MKALNSQTKFSGNDKVAAARYFYATSRLMDVADVEFCFQLIILADAANKLLKKMAFAFGTSTIETRNNDIFGQEQNNRRIEDSINLSTK